MLLNEEGFHSGCLQCLLRWQSLQFKVLLNVRLHYSFTAYQENRIESKCSIYIISDATVEFKHCIKEKWGK